MKYNLQNFCGTIIHLFDCGFQLVDVDDRVEEQTTIKAARTARRVWLKRLAHNTFSKPEQHWRPKLEAELYDMEVASLTTLDH